MSTTLAFVGPTGRYEVVLQAENTSLEDRPIVVTLSGAESCWFVEIDDMDAAGVRSPSGMTRDGSGLWFKLSLGSVVKIRYWTDGKPVRVDSLA
jgi:hypothetical protein